MDIKDMADILLKGGKMLNRSCPKCNAPVFQKEGRVFCARCGWEEGKTAGGKSEKPPTAKEDEVKVQAGPDSQGVPATETAALGALGMLEAALLNRIHEYAGKLGDREEDANLTANLEALGGLLDLLEGVMQLRARAKAAADQRE